MGRNHERGEGGRVRYYRPVVVLDYQFCFSSLSVNDTVYYRYDIIRIHVYSACTLLTAVICIYCEYLRPLR